MEIWQALRMRGLHERPEIVKVVAKYSNLDLATRVSMKSLGLPLSRYNRILGSAKFKRMALEEERKDTIYSQVIKGKGWTKVDSNLMEIVHKWIRAHPHVIESPLANDTVKVPDKNDPTKKVKTNRLLLQISIRELHNDMLEQLPEV